MASKFKFSLSGEQTPGLVHAATITAASAAKANELLDKNHDYFHAYLHDAGLHRASPAQLESAWDRNIAYQRGMDRELPDIGQTLSEPGSWKEHLGKQQYYRDFLAYFEAEIGKTSIEETVNKYMFQGDERAEDMFARMFGGLLHPMIHLGYGIEFREASVVAEALASAAIHDDFALSFCKPAEDLAKQNDPPASDRSIMTIATRLKADPKIYDAISEEDGHNKLATELVPLAGQRLSEILSEYTVKPDELQRRTAELVHTAVYFCGASQNPGKVEMFDFYLMHCANLAYFYPVFMQQAWISDESKVRLLEWTGRFNLAVYASCKSPDLYLDRIVHYKPKVPGSWDDLYARAASYGDDGHTAKLIRAIKCAEMVSQPYDGEPGFDMPPKSFLSAAHMVMDSVEKMDTPDFKRPVVEGYFDDMSEEVLRVVVRWLRFCGTQRAWADVPAMAAKS